MADIMEKMYFKYKKCKQARELLEEVWSVYGPYGDQPDKTSLQNRVAPLWRKIQDYFGYDDGE